MLAAGPERLAGGLHMSNDDRDGPRERGGSDSSVLVIVLALLAVGFVLLVVVGFGAFFFMARTAEVEEARAVRMEAEMSRAGAGEEDDPTVKDLSHDELLAVLQEKELKAGLKAGAPAVAGESAAYVFRDGAKFLDPPDTVTGRNATVEDLNFAFGFDAEGLILVTKKKTRQDAKDEASRYGTKAWHWNRFVFRGDPKLVADVRKALE
jgi:hypothetical protein